MDFSGWGCDDGECFDLFKAAILERGVAAFDYYSSYGEYAEALEPERLKAIIKNKAQAISIMYA